jgi:hypothetical protein
MLNPSLLFEDNLSFEKSHLHALSGYSGLSSSSSSASTTTPSSSTTTSASFYSSSSSSSSQPSYTSASSKTESINHDLSSSIKSSSSSGTRSQSDSNYIAALKEWAIVCKATENGKQVLLFRKGGIMEYRNGFELKYKNFFLFPTFEHQSIGSIQNEYKIELESLENQHNINKDQNNFNVSNQNIVNINLFVEVTYFNEINDINKLEKLEKFHIWNLDYVKMRFNYNPKKPLYLMLLRTYKLNDSIKIHNKPEWSGCKSWIQINLEDNTLENYATNDSFNNFEYLKSISNPCIDDITFNNIAEEVRDIIK